jgi:hypothetical protein
METSKLPPKPLHQKTIFSSPEGLQKLKELLNKPRPQDQKQSLLPQEPVSSQPQFQQASQSQPQLPPQQLQVQNPQ